MNGGYYGGGYVSYLVSGENPNVKIYGIDVPKEVFGQPTEYVLGAAGAISFLVLKGGLNIVGGIIGVGGAAVVYAAKNNMLPGNTVSGQSAFTYYPQYSY